MPGPLRLDFVTGATPDKWARTWRERHPSRGLQLRPVEEAGQDQGLTDGTADMALLRLPVDRTGRHCIRLYDEQQVVVASREHLVAAADEVTLDDLSEEQLVAPHVSGWHPAVDQLDWPAMKPKEAIETVAAGTGIVIVPASVARLFHRRDVVVRPVVDLEPTSIGLVWTVVRDDEWTQDFVGVVRGRTARSSRR